LDSVDTDNQLTNRSLDLGVDSSQETDQEVCDLVLELGESGQNTDMMTRQTLICRALWQDIKSQVYRVKTPASTKLVKFTDVSNRRNPSLFLDLVIGLACIRHRQRDKESGKNGETILYAAIEDYKGAAELFNSQSKYLSSRLDEAEQEAVSYIQSVGDEGASLGGLLECLTKAFPNDGWNTQKVRRLMEGRKDRRGGGLLEKTPGLMTFYVASSDETKHKRYKIANEKEFFTLQVTIEDPREKLVSEIPFSQISHLFPTMGKGVIDISSTYDNNNFPNIPKRGNTNLQRWDENEGNFEGKSQKIIPLRKNGKSGKGGTLTEPKDGEKLLSQIGKFVGKGGKSATVGLGPNPKKDTPTPTAKSKSELKEQVQKAICEFEAQGKPIIPNVIANHVGFSLPDVVNKIRELGYRQTEEMDHSSYMMIWKKPLILATNVQY
jgi:hypothetical protein